MTLPPRPPAWLVALVCAVLAVAFAVLAPPVLWTKLAELVAAIAANPDGALTIAGTLGAMAAAFRAAWMRRPPESTLAMRDLSGNGRDARSKPGHEPTVGDGEPEDDSDDPPPPASSVRKRSRSRLAIGSGTSSSSPAASTSRTSLRPRCAAKPAGSNSSRASSPP